MSRIRCCVLLSLLALSLLPAQAPPAPSAPDHPVITPPSAVHTVAPKYSRAATAAGVEGTVILTIIVDPSGRPTHTTVLRPLGYGLDEQAQAAVRRWRFKPGTRDGNPVAVLATVEVNFRLLNGPFASIFERQRREFSVALESLQQPNATVSATRRAVQLIQDLSRRQFPPAMYLVGAWMMKGERVKADPKRGLALIQKAAGLGSVEAQSDLGDRYESGKGLPRDLAQAEYYYRFCAARGVATCQYRLGKLLLGTDYVQALAWLELAARQHLQDAIEITAREQTNLTADQIKTIEALKPKLVQH